jgi:hypothetical protein
MGEITYESTCGVFFPLFTPLRTKDGEHIILALCVKPCQEKK